MMEKIYSSWYQFLLQEDQLDAQAFYLASLPKTLVQAKLKIKSDLVLSGTPFVVGLFNSYMTEKYDWAFLIGKEGSSFQKGQEVLFPFLVPFNEIVSLERLALNLWQRSSSITTYTKKICSLADESGVAIIDTRKTTPGLKALEKYAVRLGGGQNHRYSQTDCWMIKDNHKMSLGGLEAAWNFFNQQKNFYRPIIVEIHSLEELNLAVNLGVTHFLLDNFSESDLHQAIKIKPSHSTYEVSGGINDKNISNYLVKGVDAISMGALTHSAPQVDLSLKFGAVHG